MNTLTPENKPVQQRSIEHSQRPVTIHARNETTQAGVFLEKHFTSSQRIRRASQVWAIMWLLALASAFIPIAHFLLVPVFVIAGPTLGYLRYQQQHIPQAVEGQCPSCQQHFRLALDQRTTLPYRDVCPHCDKHIQIRALDHDA